MKYKISTMDKRASVLILTTDLKNGHEWREVIKAFVKELSFKQRARAAGGGSCVQIFNLTNPRQCRAETLF